ncbi:CKLF-like MARVEL transmembrane domain-containing protein 2, partial [Tupaia chinensis]|uniref:CKLF-like MARVEL transmembrane domain-containing protein 2 n=1 Tax=Tupaia chinensis TaxID=246437 RepID=UPI0003C8F283
AASTKPAAKPPPKAGSAKPADAKAADPKAAAGAPKPRESKKIKDDESSSSSEDRPKPKSVQPKHEVGTRKGCRRYRWELKDSNKEFWIMGHAEVKILSLGCLIAALILFNATTSHPLLTLIVTMELSIFAFFIILYSFAIQRYMPFILWPVSDLLNDLFACGFLVGAAVFAVRSRKTMPVQYFVAVVLCGLAGFFALIDMCLQRNHFKGKKIKKNILVPPPGKDKPPEPGKGKEPEKKDTEKKEPEKPKEADKGKEKETVKGKGKK